MGKLPESLNKDAKPFVPYQLGCTSVIYAVMDELINAVNKHGIDRTPLNPDMADSAKLAILVEEVGEVARAMTYDHSSEENLDAELVQVAAMAIAWATSRRRKAV